MTLLTLWAKARVYRGFAPIILIVGKQRMGKTCLALLFAYLLDKKFSPDKYMFFDILSFAKATNKYNKKILLLDEAGIELDTYRYSDVRQRCFSHIVQSQAYKQHTLFIVLPHASDLAKCHRKYVDALIVVNRRGGYIMYRPFVDYWDMNDIDINVRKMEEIYDIPLPPQHLFLEYKRKFEKQIKKGIIEGEIDKLDKYFAKEEAKLHKPKIITSAR